MAKILLIDDDEELLNVLEDFLIMDGHEIVTADDGRKGINLLEASEAFDLVITDIIITDIVITDSACRSRPCRWWPRPSG